MGRVALVTGGTRGIGAACSKALKKAGYNVAATYAGNDDAANAFKKPRRVGSHFLISAGESLRRVNAPIKLRVAIAASLRVAFG